MQLSCRKNWGFLSACAAITLLTCEICNAQAPRNTFGAGQRNRPTVSPFLNMVDNGNGGGDDGTGLNYFNLVRPIQQGRRANQKLQKELQGVESQLGYQQQELNIGMNSDALNSIPITSGRLPATGHGAGFNDLQGRFGGGTGSTSRGASSLTSQRGGGFRRGGGGNNFGNQPSGGLGIWNNTTRGPMTPRGVLGGR